MADVANCGRIKRKKGLITITIITETAVVKSGEIRQQEQQSGKKKIITIIKWVSPLVTKQMFTKQPPNLQAFEPKSTISNHSRVLLSRATTWNMQN